MAAVACCAVAMEGAAGGGRSAATEDGRGGPPEGGQGWAEGGPPDGGQDGAEGGAEVGPPNGGQGGADGGQGGMADGGQGRAEGRTEGGQGRAEGRVEGGQGWAEGRADGGPGETADGGQGGAPVLDGEPGTAEDGQAGDADAGSPARLGMDVRLSTGSASSTWQEGMDPNSCYLLKIRLFGNQRKARKEIRCFCFEKVIDCDLTNYKDLVESIVEQYLPHYLEVAHVRYYDDILKIFPEIKSDQELQSMFEKVRAKRKKREVAENIPMVPLDSPAMGTRSRKFNPPSPAMSTRSKRRLSL